MLCDTCVLIEYLRGNNKARSLLTKNSKANLAMSAVTWMELMVGAFNKQEIAVIRKAFAKFTIIEINKQISGLARELIEKFSKSHNLLIPDALIAATAIIEKMPLLTYNVSDFRFIPGLVLGDEE